MEPGSFLTGIEKEKEKEEKKMWKKRLEEQLSKPTNWGYVATSTNRRQDMLDREEAWANYEAAYAAAATRDANTDAKKDAKTANKWNKISTLAAGEEDLEEDRGGAESRAGAEDLEEDQT